MSRYDLYLSYSGRRTYIICPSQYHRKYVLKERGAPKDPKDTLFGSAIGKVFEWFYERRIWSGPDVLSATSSLIDPAVSEVLREEGLGSGFDPGYVASLTEDLRTFVPYGLETIRRHRLLTPDSRAEVDLSLVYRAEKHGLTLKLGGRADFVHRSGDDLWIQDGKASKHRERYADSEQVIWYALLHYLRHGVAPSRIGFIYWRFPDDPVQWVDYGPQSLRDSVSKTADVARSILGSRFDPTPSVACGLCPYRTSCNAGIRYMAERKVSSGGRIESSIFDLDPV